MNPLLNCILLIDDDEPTNFLHRRIVERHKCSNKVVVFQSAIEALAYLSTEQDGEFPKPDLILLDINMPAMNGWEFLEAYNKLPEAQRGSIVIMMLTTSLNVDDRTKAERSEGVSGFLSKPLTTAMLQEILETKFGWGPRD